MNFIKKANIPQILFLILVLSSCGKDKNTNAVDSETVEDTLPKMKPLLHEKKLPANYVATIKNKVDSFYNKNWPNNSMNGSFLVARNGQIIYEKYEGYANKNQKTEIDVNTPLHIASVSKVLTATAVLKLVNAGKFDLDQKVNTILKTFPYEDITVRMLLNHRSGMRNYAYFTDKDKTIWDRHNQLTNQDILNIMATKDIGLEYKPNTRFTYCNTNYAMLALIIEKATGLSYREAMKKIIFEPLKMENTFVIDYSKEYKKECQSYKGNYRFHELNHLETVYGDKNIYSTPRDLLKFQQAVASKKYLTPELVDEVFKGYSYEQRGTRNYGLGIRMMEWKDGKQLFYHNGWWHGNTTSYVDLRHENVIIIALSNKYTTMTYKSFLLATLFGDYPLELKKDELGF